MFDFLSKKFSSIFSKITGKGHLTADSVNEALEKVKDALLEADVPYDLVEEFTASVKNEAVGQKVTDSIKPGEQFVKIVHEKIKEFLGGQSVNFSFQLPSVVMVLGLQGSGKTTTIAKLAHWVNRQAKERGKQRRILLGSVDFYRPAAVDQLEQLAGQVGVDFYRSSETDPIKAAQDIFKQYKNNSYELLLLDTAGRLHVDNQMLQELRDIDANLSPRYKFLVLDAMTGQESLNVAKAFEQSVGFDSAILSKMDSDTRGGAAFSFRYALKKPIQFVGMGEKTDDLQQFHPDRMAGRILGMGDIVSLVEKAQEKIEQSEQERMEKSFMQGKLTLQDFADQMGMMNKMGSLSQVMKYMPGMGGQEISPEMIEKGEREMKQFKAIISSMTLKERVYPKVLDGSRKQRIARGSGVEVADVNALLTKFEQMQQFVKLFKGFKRFPKFF